MSLHLMLDLETLGKTPGSVILSIGACVFDRTDILSKFTARIDAHSCQQAGLTIDAHTFMWWLGQNEAARQALLREPAKPLYVALTQFSEWVGRHLIDAVWSKGPSFDCAILAAAYRAKELPVPWHYRTERCVRTALAMAGISQRIDPGEAGKAHADAAERIHHDALSDAIAQTRAIQGAMRAFITPPI